MKKTFFRTLFAGLLLLATAFATSCKEDSDKQDAIPEISVTPKTASVTTEGGVVSVTVETQNYWQVSYDELDLILSQEAGTGSAVVDIMVPAHEKRDISLTFLAHGQMGAIPLTKKAVLKIVQSDGPIVTGETIYEENCGTEVSKDGDYWPYVDKFTGWSRKGTLSQSGVTYTGSKSSVRNSGSQWGKGDAVFASDAPYVYMSKSDNDFIIGNVALKGGEKAYTLTFTAFDTYASLIASPYTPASVAVTNQNLKVQVSVDGQKWGSVAFTAEADGTNGWYRAVAPFTLPAEASNIYIKFYDFVADSTTPLPDNTYQYQASIRIDDFALTTGGNGPVVDFGEQPQPSGDPIKTTIPELIAMMSSQATVISNTNDYYFEAVVVTDKEGGNVNSNNLHVMTPGATAKGNGVCLYGSGKYTNPYDEGFDLKKGDKVKITLKAGQAKTQNYSGLYELTGAKDSDWVLIEKLGTADITPVTIKSTELAEYQGMLVSIKNATSPNEAAVWCQADKYGQHTFSTTDGSFTVFTQSKMPTLVDRMFTASATGTVSGYATVYKENGQICPQSVNDVSDFMSSDPQLSISPEKLSFKAAGGAQQITATLVNSQDAISATVDNTAQFSVSVSGNIITVNAQPNATSSPITGTVTVSAGSLTKTCALTQAAQGTSGTVETLLDFTTYGYTNGTKVGEQNFYSDDVTVVFHKNKGSTDPAYYTDCVRLYYSGSLVVSGSNISKIEFTFGNGDNSASNKTDNVITASEGTLTEGVWTGSSDAVTFTIGEGSKGTSGHRRISKLNITYEGTAGPKIIASDITGVPAEGVSGATVQISLSNITETVKATPDGSVVTAASVSGETLTYSVSQNTGAAREGYIKLSANGIEKTIRVLQVEKVEFEAMDPTNIKEGTYFLAYKHTDNKYYLMKNAVYKSYYVEATAFDTLSNITEDYQFTVKKSESGYTIQNSQGGYVAITISGTYINLIPSQTKPCVWTLEAAQNAGGIKATTADSQGYCLSFNGQYIEYTTSSNYNYCPTFYLMNK